VSGYWRSRQITQTVEEPDHKGLPTTKEKEQSEEKALELRKGGSSQLRRTFEHKVDTGSPLEKRKTSERKRWGKFQRRRGENWRMRATTGSPLGGRKKKCPEIKTCKEFAETTHRRELNRETGT